MCNFQQASLLQFLAKPAVIYSKLPTLDKNDCDTITIFIDLKSFLIILISQKIKFI